MRADCVIGFYKMRLMAVVEGAPSIREGCRRAQIAPSTYYRWLQLRSEYGPDGLMPRDRVRRVGAARRRLEAEVTALALANPPWGPRRLFSELQRRRVEVGSASMVWRILVAHGINTRARRYAVMATAKGLTMAEVARTEVGSAAVGWEEMAGGGRGRPFVGSLQAEVPGDLVQLDCFHLGRLRGAKKTDTGQATVWQYTAIDVASSFVWAETHTTRHAPSGVHTSAMVHRVAADLARWGWQLEAVSTDSGNEFRDHLFTNACLELGVEHRFIPAGRPQSNGKVEQVHNTILEECWKPSFVGYRTPTPTSAAADLADYLTYYNTQRPHWGKWNQGQTPTDIIIPNTGNMP